MGSGFIVGEDVVIGGAGGAGNVVVGLVSFGETGSVGLEPISPPIFGLPTGGRTIELVAGLWLVDVPGCADDEEEPKRARALCDRAIYIMSGPRGILRGSDAMRRHRRP